jgi:hypothetical protein
MVIMKKIILSLVAASALAMANNQVELNINNDTVEVNGDIYLNDIYEVSNDSNYYFTASYLSSSQEPGDRQTLVTAGLKILNPFVNDNGLSLGLGIKGVVADNSSQTFAAIPLGLFIKYELNEKIQFNANMNYAPQTLSFSDAKAYREFKLTADYKVLENGYVFVGSRYIKTSYDKSIDLTYDKSMFFGYKVQF